MFHLQTVWNSNFFKKFRFTLSTSALLERLLIKLGAKFTGRIKQTPFTVLHADEMVESNTFVVITIDPWFMR